jgi:HKD family nuclease
MALTQTLHPTFLAGSPQSPPDLRAVLHKAYETHDHEWQARFGFAYASESGLEVILSALDDVELWASTRKRWILGLHHGITEPAAIQRIRSLENSQVRIFIPGGRLTLESLLLGPRFHAKTVCIDRSPNHIVTCLLTTSANLTAAALADTARNYEAGIALYSGLIPRNLGVAFNRWWEEAWNASTEVSEAMISQYIRLRDEFLRRNLDALTGFDPPSLRKVKSASSLWIEAGAMSGGSRNQVEFNRDLTAFFGPIRSFSRTLRITAQRHVWDDRPLSPKTTTFGVEIWRLSLPTYTQGGFVYPDKVIQFRRQQDSQGLFFELNVADLDSLQYRRWRENAHRHGYLGVTSGNRSYGFY